MKYDVQSSVMFSETRVDYLMEHRASCLGELDECG